MFRISVCARICLVLMSCVSVSAQQPAAAATGVVPPMVKFDGVLRDANGKALTGAVGVTLALYKDSRGGAPLWIETQNVQADQGGHYSVMLGATSSHGLPGDLFVSGEARWLGVQANGVEEQPRVLLLSVPYALKAADAETIGGLTPSAFVLAASPDSASSTPSSSPPNSNSNPPALGGSGKPNFLPLWTKSTTLGNSVVFQSGSGSKAKVGINTTKPVSTLDVKGGGTIRGLFSLPPTGTATATTGFNSQPEDLAASVFNSGTGTAVPQTFQWQAESVNNDTSNATGSLNLLFAQGAGTPTETGLNIASNGRITFASGQTFPGTGTGTVTSVGLSAPNSDFNVSGSPVTGAGTLGLTWNVPPDTNATPNAIVKRDSIGAFSASGIYADAIYVTGVLATAIYASTSDISGTGVYGQATGANGTGVTGTGPTGVTGTGPTGVLGSTVDGFGVYGYSSGSGTAVYGAGGTIGVSALSDGVALQAESNVGQALVAQTFAGSTADTAVIINYGGGIPLYAAGTGGSMFLDANGDLSVSGAFSAGGAKQFKIDHPLDPANKYLVHASVESSEMMNIYTGNITTDAQGQATVTLPQWFEVLNADFRYQLTVIGQFAQAIVAREIQDHQFAIRTSAPNVKVSWQVTGVRQDAYAKAHPMVVEEEKEEKLRGYYIHPEFYGAPKDRSIEAAHQSESMKRMKERTVLPHPAIKPVAQSHPIRASK